MLPKIALPVFTYSCELANACWIQKSEEPMHGHDKLNTNKIYVSKVQTI